MKTQSVILLLGGNEGNVLSNFSAALAILEREAGHIARISPVYKTAAWGPVVQSDFLNMAVEIKTIISPGLLMKILLATEKRFGRKRQIKYGPRTLDIDMIFYGRNKVNIPGLKVPHPEMHKRRFVLKPCSDLIPEFRHPVFNKTVQELLKTCTDPLVAEKYNP